jgi:hypothetical protein
MLYTCACTTSSHYSSRSTGSSNQDITKVIRNQDITKVTLRLLSVYVCVAKISAGWTLHKMLVMQFQY